MVRVVKWCFLRNAYFTRLARPWISSPRKHSIELFKVLIRQRMLPSVKGACYPSRLNKPVGKIRKAYLLATSTQQHEVLKMRTKRFCVSVDLASVDRRTSDREELTRQQVMRLKVAYVHSNIFRNSLADIHDATRVMDRTLDTYRLKPWHSISNPPGFWFAFTTLIRRVEFGVLSRYNSSIFNAMFYPRIRTQLSTQKYQEMNNLRYIFSHIYSPLYWSVDSRQHSQICHGGVQNRGVPLRLKIIFTEVLLAVAIIVERAPRNHCRLNNYFDDCVSTGV